MGVSIYDETLGGLLAGTWANTIVFTLEVIQIFRYFKNYPHDSFVLRGIVSLAFFGDIVSTVGDYACVYLYCVTNWGDITYLEQQNWTIPNYVVTTALSAAIAQTFLIYRFWKLSNNHVISVILLGLMLTALGATLATTVFIVHFTALSERNRVIRVATVWLVTSAVTDIVIALALVWELHRIKSSIPNTVSLISRLMRNAMETGCATAFVALAALVLFLINNEANFAVGVAFTLGRVYTLTLLFNLNRRKRSSAGESDGIGRTDYYSSRRGQQSEAFDMGGIHVLRTMQVIEDDDRHGAATSTVTMDAKSALNDGRPSVEKIA